MSNDRHTDRRAFLRRLGVVAAAAALIPVARAAQAARGEYGAGTEASKRPQGVTDLARERTARLPKGGTYDHQSQQMTGYEIDVAGTATGGGEDNCCGSTTFWDGEKS